MTATTTPRRGIATIDDLRARSTIDPATRQLPGLYTLTTPETDIAAWGPNLALVKRCGEQLAADRAEFTCTPKGWQP